jgi:hypothetical protein
MNEVDRVSRKNRRHQRISAGRERNRNSPWRAARQKQQRSPSPRLKTCGV